ncbi:MAG: hypothetical protein A2X84_00420 [Desulfuromonadaceae bacterium GWC2_58_13]|nr:MAG: hypothetical protein A2X84_00420 [Desulfuromonadaceae bacterium GWC2_58_13]
MLDVRICRLVLIAFTCLALVPTQGRAALVVSQLADGGTSVERRADLETVRQALEHEMVAQRLADYGLTPEQVAAKLPEFSDDQLHQLASLSDSLAEGGVVGLVIGVLLIILLVIVILKITDKRVTIH